MFLDRLILAKDTQSFPAEDPQKLAYQLREAVHACKHHEEYIHYYNEIDPFYKFSTTPGMVVAKWVGADDTTRSALTKPAYKEFPAATTLLDIVGAAQKAGSIAELFFPNADMEEPLIEKKLPLFCKKYGWKAHAPALGGITLIRDTKGQSHDL